MDYPFPIPAIGSAASLLLLFNQGNSMWGGNIPSTLAGEFSFSIAFALAVLFIGLLYRGIRSGRHRAGLAVLLALVGLCHPVPFISAAAAGLFFLLDPTTLRRNLVYLAWVYAAAALLMAFWLVPLIAGLPYATSIHWEWQFQSWMDVLPPMLVLPAVMAGIDAVRLLRKRRVPAAGHYVLFSLLVSAAAFCAANSVGVPDIRFIPFAQFVVLLLALDLLSAFLPALPAPGLPALAIVAATLGFVEMGAGYIPPGSCGTTKASSARASTAVLQQLMAALKGSLADPRVGYEHSPSYDAFGSMRIFESLPRLAHRATLEGVLLQTSVTSPFVYYIQSLVSEQGTSVIPGYSYPDSDPARGTPRLDLFNVRDFLAVSDKVKAALDKDPRWTRLFVLEPYVIYRRTETPAGYVRVPKFRPVLIETTNWKKDFHRWFDKDALLDVPLVSARTVPASAREFFPVSSTSPTDIPRVPETSQCAVTEKMSSLEIEFTTTCPGIPHYIAVAYHPNWRVEGAARRLPGQSRVHDGRSPAAGRAAPIRPQRRRLGGDPGDARRHRAVLRPAASILGDVAELPPLASRSLPCRDDDIADRRAGGHRRQRRPQGRIAVLRSARLACLRDPGLREGPPRVRSDAAVRARLRVVCGCDVLARLEHVPDGRLRGRRAGVRGADRPCSGERLGPGEPVPDRHLPGPARSAWVGRGGIPANRRAVRAQPMVGRGRRSLAGDPWHSRDGDTMTRVLVTGGTGFIGSALVPRLVQAGYVPRLLVRRAPSSVPPAPIEVTVGDVTDVETLRLALRDAPAVVHMAAATSAGRLDPAVAYRVNVGAASALVDACRQAGARLIVLSTQHVYLPAPWPVRAHEANGRSHLPGVRPAGHDPAAKPRLRARALAACSSDWRPSCASCPSFP